MKITLVLTLTAIICAVTASPAAASHRNCQQARTGLRFYMASTHRWETEHDGSPTPRSTISSHAGCAYVRWAASRWRDRSRSARAGYETWLAQMDRKWGCIHQHEGSWTDEGLPQMGGLQMDLGFQGTYGSEFVARWGDAGHWPVWAQYIAAERAYHGYHGYGPRYFRPWTTAASCGL